jgi:predicted phosphodiesterase
MRLAILADIHGNLPAFEAALEHAARQKVDQMVLAGDIINGGPDSAACWQLAKSLHCPILRGNHERYAAHYGTAQAEPVWSTELFAPLHWTVSQFSKQERQEMAHLPLQLRLPEAADLLIVHASARSDSDSITSHTPEEKLGEFFAGTDERYLIRSHNHYGLARLWGSRFIVTNGSVGLPLDGHPTAQYLLLDQEENGWHIRHQSVPYDLELAIRRFYETGYLEATGVMGRLFFREVVTATQQLVPFLRLYTQWSQGGPVSLAAAMERFTCAY